MTLDIVLGIPDGGQVGNSMSHDALGTTSETALSVDE